ncbi:MAG: hypothetical protein F6K36_22550 [Symploca sp. SIO3C6]|uniref:JAB domain-containing protein n=1 Tax=Symploca sp. SIO1C4 TaxID=2607765 RepID=A0A6B3ND66_9CYAN|nr:hypothetical protein [Symploca sp. SIO3C6]NER31516.1 hypothetical protein [Symploca sp. SIO1C4]
MQLIDHKIIRQTPLPPHTSSLFEYLFAGNGVFVRGVRPGLQVIMPVHLYNMPIRGLSELKPQLKLEPYPIPKDILISIWRQSCLARNDRGLIEILFHIQHRRDGWELRVPEQTQQTWQCQTTQPYHEAIAEFHSHGSGTASFSATDNAEEDGFRLYGIIGRLHTIHPEILIRAGLFGHFLIVPASCVFDLPDFLIDVAVRDQIAYQYYTINHNHHETQL